MKLKTILILVAILAITGTTYYFISRPDDTTEPTEETYYVWDFEMTNLQHITMSLPKVDLTGSWVKNPADQNFYFDYEGGPKVDNQRWGGGIPLLLSGPGANRLIFQNVPESEMGGYGFDEPNLVAILTLDDGSIYEVVVGDSNPEETGYYVRLKSNQDVYLVDASWYGVLANIVINPPYVQATFSEDLPSVSAGAVLSADPFTVATGTPVTVNVNVNNTGDVEGTYDVVMKINGEIRETKTTDIVAAQSGTTVTFTVTENAPGKYIVSINSRNVTFYVE